MHRIAVLPAVDDRSRDELFRELQAAFPEARVDTATGDGRIDVLVLPFTRRLHRRFISEKTRLLAQGLRTSARMFVMYDVTHRRTDVVPRLLLPIWYLRRLGESLVVLLARKIRWQAS